VHNLNRKAAEHDELAAHGRRTSAEHNKKGENSTGNWHAQRLCWNRRERVRKSPMSDRAAELHDLAAPTHVVATEARENKAI
jgi:hypothetical protein